jgi:hypothetical protein
MRSVFNSLRYRLLLATLISLLLVGQHWVSGLNQIRQSSAQVSLTLLEQRADFWPGAQFLQATAFGHWALWANWSWIQSLQLIGEWSDQKESPAPLKLDLAETAWRNAIALDPNFLPWYLDAGLFFSFFSKRPQVSYEILTLAVERMNQPMLEKQKDYGDWQRAPMVAILRGYTAAFGLRDWKLAQSAFLDAERIPGSPAYLKNMAEWLSKPGGEKELGHRILETLIRQTTDERQKAAYEAELKKILES